MSPRSSRADPHRWEPATIHMQPLPSSTSSRATHADICTGGVSTGHAGESWCQEVVPPTSFGLYCTWSCQTRSSFAPVMRATSLTIDGLRVSRANASLACQMLTICHTGRPSVFDRSTQRTGRQVDAAHRAAAVGEVGGGQDAFQLAAQLIHLGIGEHAVAQDESLVMELLDLCLAQHDAAV